jgi:hypothetical protein
MEAEAQEKRRLTEQTLQLDPGPTQKSLVGPQSIPVKQKLVRIDKLDLTLIEIRANSPGLKDNCKIRITSKRRRSQRPEDEPPTPPARPRQKPRGRRWQKLIMEPTREKRGQG